MFYKSFFRVTLFTGLMCLLLSCTDFSASKCKGHSIMGDNVSVHGLLTTFDESATPGLKCISWEIDGEDLSLDLINFKGGCEEEWKADEDVDGHKITLDIEEDDGLIKSDASCGWCYYDFSFQIDDVPKSGDVALKIKMEERPTETYTIRDADREQGFVCKIDADSDSCCSIHQFCSLKEDDDEGRFCDEGLTCIPDTPDSWYGVCYKDCASDTDCPDKPVPTRCQDNICQFVDTF